MTQFYRLTQTAAFLHSQGPADHSQIDCPSMCSRLDMEPASQRRHSGLTIVGVLLILFGAAEVITAFTHKFFGISTALGAVSAVLAAAYTQLPGYSS
jgi:hypothetical protein